MNSSHKHDLLDEVEMLDTPGGGHLRLRFSGPFEGREVRWDATLYTPAAWAELRDEEIPRQNIIQLGEDGREGIELAICLQVTAIDCPTVRKAVMMIRLYRRLSRGRHIYGGVSRHRQIQGGVAPT